MFIYLSYFFFSLDNDYYYGGSMRDLNNGYGRPRKASSVSHLGTYDAWDFDLSGLISRIKFCIISIVLLCLFCYTKGIFVLISKLISAYDSK